MSRSENVTGQANAEPDENAVLAITETLYSKMIAVMNDLPQIEQADFDFAALKTHLLLPIARYLAQQSTSQTHTPFLKPLFLSGVPGIGKTTLLMILDEALHQLNASCRDLVASGTVGCKG